MSAPTEMGVDEMLAAIARHARSWEPDARLLGNLRAEDIAVACEGTGRLLEGRSRYATGYRDKWLRYLDLVKRAFPLVSVAPAEVDGQSTGRARWIGDAREALLAPMLPEAAEWESWVRMEVESAVEIARMAPCTDAMARSAVESAVRGILAFGPESACEP